MASFVGKLRFKEWYNLVISFFLCHFRCISETKETLQIYTDILPNIFNVVSLNSYTQLLNLEVFGIAEINICMLECNIIVLRWFIFFF